MDGFQIGALVMSHYLQHNTYLFGTPENDYEDSMVYKAQGALYGFTDADGIKGNIKYFYAGEEKDMNEWKKTHKFKLQKRWKGLGELSREELRQQYLDPSTRRLFKMKPKDVEDSLLIASDSNRRKELMVEQGVLSLDTMDLQEIYSSFNNRIQSKIK